MGKNAIGALIPDRAIFRPTTADVSEGEAPDKVSVQRVATVSNGISLKEAWFGDIPVVGFNRDLVFEKRSGLGATESPLVLPVTRTGFKVRSMVEGLIVSSFAFMSASRAPYSCS